MTDDDAPRPRSGPSRPGLATTLLEALIAEVRPRLLVAPSRRDPRIASHPVAAGVLRALAVAPEPLSVRAIVATPDGWRARRERCPSTTTRHGLGIGFCDPSGGRCVGRLVTPVDDRRVLDQVSPPEGDIPVSAGWFGPVEHHRSGRGVPDSAGRLAEHQVHGNTLGELCRRLQAGGAGVTSARAHQ